MFLGLQTCELLFGTRTDGVLQRDEYVCVTAPPQEILSDNSTSTKGMMFTLFALPTKGLMFTLCALQMLLPFSAHHNYKVHYVS